MPWCYPLLFELYSYSTMRKCASVIKYLCIWHVMKRNSNKSKSSCFKARVAEKCCWKNGRNNRLDFTDYTAHWFFLFLWFNILSNTLSRYFFCSVFCQKDGASINTNCCLPQFCIRQKQKKHRVGGAVTPLLEIQTVLGALLEMCVSKGTVCGPATWEEGFLWIPRMQWSPFTVQLFPQEANSYGLILLHFWNQMPFLQTLAKTGHLGFKSDHFSKLGALFSLGDMSANHRSKNPSSSLPTYVVPQPGSHMSLEAEDNTHLWALRGGFCASLGLLEGCIWKFNPFLHHFLYF